MKGKCSRMSKNNTAAAGAVPASLPFASDKPLLITDTILRDAHQSQAATRMRIGDMLPALEQLDEAIALGYTELWQLADFFGVTESFMRKAVCLYVHGNLASELYF